MPKVNIQYTLTKDVLIDTIQLFEIQGISVKYFNNRVSPTEYEGKIKQITVADDVNIELRLHGQSNSKWSLKIKIIKLKKGRDESEEVQYSEITTHSIAKEPIEGILKDSYQYYNETHPIKW